MRRDAFGERPLYFTFHGGVLRTGPSARRLQAESGVPAGLDADAAARALCGALEPHTSLFRGVGRVPPGHELRPGPRGPSLSPWWQPPLIGRDALPVSATPDALLHLLREAVRRRADDRPAVALSGGLDSGAVLALLAQSGAPVRACLRVDDFTDPAERERAELLAASLGASLTRLEVTEEELPAHAVEAVCACEEPIWNGRAVASLLFFRRARVAGITTLLSGVGADEVMCGNPAGLAAFQDRWDAEARLARSLLNAAVGRRPPRRIRSPVPPGVPPLAFLQDAHLRHVLPDSTLPPECRCSAAEGVEVRLPYLDLPLAELALRLPVALRIDGDLGKRLLRQALAGLLPQAVCALPKHAALAPPGGSGTQARLAWDAFLDTWLSPRRLAALRWVEPRRVRRLLAAFRRDPLDHPARPVRDAVLMRLASLSVLAETTA